MYVLNKIVWFVLNPAMLVVAGGVVGLVLVGRGQGSASSGRGKASSGREDASSGREDAVISGKRFASPAWRRIGLALLALTLAFFWFMSSLVGVCALGIPLERSYLNLQRPEETPAAGAIVVLGGGIAKKPEMAYPEMYDGADRLWHAARLYKAGKAPRVVVSGSNDLEAAVPLLVDLGVPRAAIAVDNESRNTYENSRFVERLLATYKGSDPLYVKMPAATNAVDALVVTSAWHMPRALGNFAKTGLRCAPAPCDFKAYDSYHARRFPWDWIAPSPDAFVLTSAFMKEWIGRLARK